MLKRNAVPEELTGHDLLAEYAAATEAFQLHLEAIASDAADRETVVDSRLADLEAEKAVLKQLGGMAQPALVARDYEGPGRLIPDEPQA